MESLFFYPKLTENLKDECGLSASKYVFSYSYQEKVFELNQKGSSTIKLLDPLEIWTIEDEGISFSKTITIAYPQLLFGKNGIACQGASIGICRMWTNKKLTQTGCIMPEKDLETETGRTCVFNHSFAPGSITGDLELSVVMYIKQRADEINSGVEKLVNEEGVTIGEIETITLDFNSVYMEFPIEELNNRNDPLWWVEFSQWDDPKVDMFSRENICLYLNSYYDACPMVGETIRNLDLLIDILATTYYLIFERIAEDQEDLKATQQNLGLENYSICSIMHQFLETCPNPELLLFGNPEKLLKGLQINIRKMLEEGDGQ